MTYCFGRCGAWTDDDDRPWLVITGWRMGAARVPFSAVVCPDCEDSLAYLADELDDLMGVRLPDNSPASLAAALRDWPVQPGGR
jgi:hypothetical protein